MKPSRGQDERHRFSFPSFPSAAREKGRQWPCPFAAPAESAAASRVAYVGRVGSSVGQSGLAAAFASAFADHAAAPAQPMLIERGRGETCEPPRTKSQESTAGRGPPLRSRETRNRQVPGRGSFVSFTLSPQRLPFFRLSAPPTDAGLFFFFFAVDGQCRLRRR